MGAVAVWLLRHAKMVLAWSIILAAFAVFVSSVSHSTAFSKIATCIDDAVDMITRVATSVPQNVNRINSAISYSLQNSNGIGALMFWLAGFDILLQILTFIAAQISAIVSLVTVVGGSALVLAGASWTLRKTQRFVVALTGGDANGVQVVD